MNTSIINMLGNMPAEIVNDNEYYGLVIRKMQDNKYYVAYEHYNEELSKELFGLERGELLDALTDVSSWLKENNYLPTK